MRGLVLALAIVGAPALAWAQTSNTGGALAEEPASATATQAGASAAQTSQPASDTQQASPPATGVAAPGISVSSSGDTSSSTATTHRRQAAPSGAAAPGIVAPGVSANGAAQDASAPPRTTIEPVNALERAFVNAARQENQRAAFRRIFLDAQVALATVSADANAAPRVVRLGPAGEACLIFTSDARATQIMGARSPRQMMSGREALQRLRGAHLVIININLDPYLTLDAAGIEGFLGADAAPDAAPRSAGPSQ